MRLVPALILLATLIGCTRSNGLYVPSSDDGGGDGAVDLASRDLSGVDLPKPMLDMGRPPDLAGRVCGSTCAKCVGAACCSGGCCRPGEFCESGQCRCGAGASCGVNEVCASAGPVSNNLCGSICCGSPSKPCPL